MLKFWQRYWYYIGGVIFVAGVFFMGLVGQNYFNTVQTILIYSWFAMLVHQFEEYAFPGGFPLIANVILNKQYDHPQGYPFNSLQCFASNVLLCYACYIIPIFFPNLIWLAASQIFAGLWQIPSHAILTNVRMKTIYNPGLGATVFLQIPIAAYFVNYVVTNMPEAASQLGFGVLGSLVILIISFGLPVLLMRDKTYSHDFEERELYGYKKDFVRNAWEKGQLERDENSLGEEQ